MIKLKVDTKEDLSFKGNSKIKIKGNPKNVLFEMEHIIFNVFYKTLLDVDEGQKSTFASDFLKSISKTIKTIK